MDRVLAYRTCTIFAVVLAVFAGGSLGISNGRVLCVDGTGQLAIELPHLSHAHRHVDDADHELYELNVDGGDAEHDGMHARIASCADSVITVQTVQRSLPYPVVANPHYPTGFHLFLSACPAGSVRPSTVSHGLGVPTFRGGTAHPELASLRSVILLV